MRPETATFDMTEDAARRALFDRLLAEHGPGIRRVARVYARGGAEEADLAQEIAVAVWRALPAFRAECTERTFVYRIAHNRGITHVEGRRLRATTPIEDAPQVPDPRPSPEVALDAARRRDALFRALAELPVGSRAVITLALEGLSHAEIADVLGSTENSVAVRLSRGRAELRERLRTLEAGR
ncbi:MAG: sigma-70 family RNA polymerase sigma factor [Myxococcales bacterium]|jgi:RNA polymerase sigma-70 factor (ECF subfamily)|nr:sigma-70 family RNA polymerase sigma factor [Myxococcales bacterium]